MLKLQVIGHLGKDCTTNVVNGKNVINFSVAHKTLWVECAYWTERTAIAPYLKKGQQVYCEGIPDIRTYTKNDGTSGTSLTLRVLSVQLLGGGSRNESGDTESSAENMSTASAGPDDLPF